MATRNGYGSSRRPGVPLPSSGELAEIQNKLGIAFRNTKHLQQALIHRSYLNETDIPGLKHYERLEFLGDAVLEMVVTNYLFRNFPEEQEGVLTDIRASLVCSRTLTMVAEKLELEHCIRMSRGEERSFGVNEKSRRYILACVVEAIVGAIYLDRGVGSVELFLDEVLLPLAHDILDKQLYRDSKSYLQELLQADRHLTPEYRILDQSGPDHNTRFSMGVYAGKELLGIGKGGSKKEAETEAARTALREQFQIELTTVEV